MEELDSNKLERNPLENWILMVGMIIVYGIMLTLFIPLWSKRDCDAGSVIFLAGVFFNMALLTGIHREEFLKNAYKISSIAYLLVALIAVFTERFSFSEIVIGTLVLAAIFLMKYGIIVIPKVKKIRKEKEERLARSAS